MAKLKAIHNHIIFQFEEGLVKHMGVDQFENKTDWGFTFVRTDSTTQSPRWAKVVKTGPECDSDIQVGMRILIENLRWSEGFDFEGDTYWRTDSDQVLGIDSTVVPV